MVSHIHIWNEKRVKRRIASDTDCSIETGPLIVSKNKYFKERDRHGTKEDTLQLARTRTFD
jgi:hypothetical protein